MYMRLYKARFKITPLPGDGYVDGYEPHTNCCFSGSNIEEARKTMNEFLTEEPEYKLVSELKYYQSIETDFIELDTSLTLEDVLDD